LGEEVAALYAAPDAQADGTLQFMTIHKAKGLEFDTVILPGLQRKGRGDEHELMLWEEVALEGLTEQLVAAPLSKRSRGADKSLPTPYDYLRQLEQERSANENARVLYVAATRAISSLHLVGVAKINEEGEALRPSGTFLDLIWDSVVEHFAAVVAGADSAGHDTRGHQQSDASEFVPKLVRVTAPVVAVGLQLPPVQALPDFAQDSLLPTEAGAATTDALAASVGTLVHAYLELVARSGIEHWGSQRISALRPAMVLWLVQRGHASVAAKQGAERVEAVLQTTLASAAGRWVLQARADDAAELALARLNAEADGGQVTTHIVDRSFVENGQRWIIDYKTAQVADQTAALAAHAERYRAQLERYAQLFAGAGLPLRLAIFYAAHGCLVELQGSSATPAAPPGEV
ncbi:MAG: PD-(D/E)XK nuclease family protein, partial [Proteobacteria bacterium]|nr:PD-(D/E)XK nuclease family protein [Pseudomonadota bacterium]